MCWELGRHSPWWETNLIVMDFVFILLFNFFHRKRRQVWSKTVGKTEIKVECPLTCGSQPSIFQVAIQNWNIKNYQKVLFLIFPPGDNAIYACSQILEEILKNMFHLCQFMILISFSWTVTPSNDSNVIKICIFTKSETYF